MSQPYKAVLNFNHPIHGHLSPKLEVELDLSDSEKTDATFRSLLDLPDGCQVFVEHDTVYCTLPHDLPADIGTLQLNRPLR